MMLNIFMYKIPKKLPLGMQRVVEQLKKTKSKMECLRMAYDVLGKRFHGEKLYFLRKPSELFVTNLEKIWNTRKVLNCTTVNYLLRALLIRSGKFTDKDLKNQWTLISGFSIHQYVRANVDGKIINVDLWGHSNKVPFGEYAHGF